MRVSLPKFVELHASVLFAIARRSRLWPQEYDFHMSLRNLLLETINIVFRIFLGFLRRGNMKTAVNYTKSKSILRPMASGLINEKHH